MDGQKNGRDRNRSTPGLGIVETFHETSLRGFRTHLPMFEVWMQGVVLCF